MAQLIPTADVAQLLGVSRRTVARLAASGTLPPAAKGPGMHGALLFDPAAVDAYAERSVTA